MKTVMGFAEIFDQLFFSCELGCKKPDPIYYDLIAEKFGLDGSSILFWDDSPSNVASTRQQGWHAEQYTDFRSSRELLPRL